MAVTIASAANYWINPNALSITLNALGEANRIQASVASGAAILCYINGVKRAGTKPDSGNPNVDYSKNGDGLEFDNGHNYKRWPLIVSPTYFSSNTEKYVYVAIPRSTSIGAEAAIVFPSKKIDIYGYTLKMQPVMDSEGRMRDKDGNVTTDLSLAVKEEVRDEQVGNDNYFYIWLQGIISSSGENGYTPREWLQRPESGTLSTDEALSSTETEWYRWDSMSNTVVFLKEIWMNATSRFYNLVARAFTLNGHTLNGVAVKGETPEDSDDTIVTPAYLGGMSDEKYLRKDKDDRTEYSIGIGGGLFVDNDARVKGTLYVPKSVHANDVRSDNYTGDTMSDTGFLLTNGAENGSGRSKLTVDELYVRIKAVFESLEVKKWHVLQKKSIGNI